MESLGQQDQQSSGKSLMATATMHCSQSAAVQALAQTKAIVAGMSQHLDIALLDKSGDADGTLVLTRGGVVQWGGYRVQAHLDAFEHRACCSRGWWQVEME